MSPDYTIAFLTSPMPSQLHQAKHFRLNFDHFSLSEMFTEANICDAVCVTVSYGFRFHLFALETERFQNI